MFDVVPGVLQRISEADIVSVAGLKIASLGQEFCRLGVVHSLKRQGAHLSGIVDVSQLTLNSAAKPANTAPTRSTDAARAASAAHSGGTQGEVENAFNLPGRFYVEVEILHLTTWKASCTCNVTSNSSPYVPPESGAVAAEAASEERVGAASICSHAAALLYQWVAHPATFLSPASNPLPISSFYKKEEKVVSLIEDRGNDTMLEAKATRATASLTGYSSAQQRSVTSGNLGDIVAQLGLSELRSIAREYDISTNGLSKQQLQEALLEALQQPESIRHVVGTLEKQQRQLLAALTLIGGSVSDDDLRGLYERFALGNPNQFQSMLLALQNRALIFHTGLNNSLQQRIGTNGSLFDISWHVPLEVRTALRVTLPITPFDIDKSSEKDAGTLNISLAEPFRLLADMLLVARALEGSRLENEIEKDASNGSSGDKGDRKGLAPHPYPTADGSVAIPPPVDMASAFQLAPLEEGGRKGLLDQGDRKGRPYPTLSFSEMYLRFAVRLLRWTDILYKDGAELSPLHALPNAARLLLGPTRAEVARELFSSWLTSATYVELFDLQEEGLRLRCRATPLGHPVLRQGELEAENSEARQTLVALIAQVPFNTWINFSAFARFVYRLHPTFLQKRQRQFSSPHWWLEQEEGRILRPVQLNDWLRAEGRYLAQLLEGPLYWWGAADIAHASDGRLLAFRLTPLANFLLHGTAVSGNGYIDKNDLTLTRPANAASAPSSETQGNAGPLPSLELLGNEDIGNLLIPCTPTQWRLIGLVEEFAEVAGVHNGKLHYRLSPQSLSEALGHGHNPAGLLELLHAIAVGPVQLEMLAQLEQRIANYGRVRLYTGSTLLEAAESLVLRELSATTSFDKQVVRSIAPTQMILKKRGAEQLVDELRRRGQLPLLHEGETYGAE